MNREMTPGPWEARDDDGTGTLPCVLSDKVNAGGNFYVAQCNVFEDARLIAAAPELLEVLEEVESRMARHGSGDVLFHSRVMAAIAKAKGE